VHPPALATEAIRALGGPIPFRRGHQRTPRARAKTVSAIVPRR